MAKVETITFAVTTNFREAMARELREAAEVLDPQPVIEIAEHAGEFVSIPWPPDDATETLIRAAIADPGQFVSRNTDAEGYREPVPSWSARAVLEALGRSHA